MCTYKIEFKLIRKFGIGFDIYSPKLNGLAFSVTIGCFELMVRNRGKKLFGYNNYWN